QHRSGQRRVGGEPDVDTLGFGAHLGVGLHDAAGGIGLAGHELGELIESVAHGQVEAHTRAGAGPRSSPRLVPETAGTRVWYSSRSRFLPLGFLAPLLYTAPDHSGEPGLLRASGQP